jgi:methionyl aminopeptidase
MPAHYTKTTEEIATMQECGRRLRTVYERLIPTIRVGETTNEINARAERLLTEAGLEHSFKTVPGYRWATCLCVNNQAVHTPPSDYSLRDGDVLTVDVGGLYNGYHTDWATTLIVGTPNARKEHFLAAGRRALERTLQILRPGVYLGDVGEVMQREIEGAGYCVLRELTGHGVGRSLHEDPYIPNFVQRPKNQTYQITEGFVAAIEIIYSESTEHIRYDRRDGWTIESADGSLAACFEHTVCVTSDGVQILT